MKSAMIWGADGGIGRALLAELAGRDWTVIAVSRQPESLVELTPTSFEADVANDFAVQQAVLSASYEVSEVDLWVYAVGDIASEPVDAMQPDTWQRLLDANLTGAYRATHHSLPLLAADAHLFYLGAASERLRLPGLSAYAAAKAGLEAFAASLAKEQRQRRVTVVQPTAVATSLWDKVPLRLPKNAAGPEEVARRLLAAYDEGHSGLLELI